MRFSRPRISLALALAGSVGLLVIGCADFKRGAYWDVDGDDDGDLDGTGDAGELRYAADIHPLLDAGCERCHAATNSAGNTGYLVESDDIESSYATALEFVDLDAPADSRLLTKMAGQNHGAGVIFDDRSPEYDLTLAWIEQGAAL
jgi:hypothetical protein